MPRWQVLALSLNNVVGSGVYLLPAAAAALLGAASVTAIVLAGLAVGLIVLCFAEAGSFFDRPGGAYRYTREAFGPLVGFEVGWMTWLARVSAVASLSVGFVQALTFLWPSVGTGAPRAIAITLPLVVLTTLNVVGIRSGAGAAVLLVAAKLVPLLVFVVAGAFAVSSVQALRSTVLVTSNNLREAALLLLFAYAGFENTPAPAGEYRHPRRDVPFALIVQLVIVTLLYVAVQWVALGTLPGIAESPTPLADAARRFLGPLGGVLLTAGAAVSILGTSSNTVLAGPRYLFALAEDGFGPRVLRQIHPRWRTPAVAIVTQSAIALPLALAGTFTGLAELSVVARLATYIGTAAAVPVLRRKLAGGQEVVRLPGGWLVPTAAIAVCVILAASATARNLLAGGVALAVGLLVYAAHRPQRQASA